MYCPMCGARNSETARFCGTCGQTLREKAAREQAPVPEPPPPAPAHESGPGYRPFRDVDVSPYTCSELPCASHSGDAVLLRALRDCRHLVRGTGEWEGGIGGHGGGVADVPEREELGVDFFRGGTGDHGGLGDFPDCRGYGGGAGGGVSQ